MRSRWARRVLAVLALVAVTATGITIGTLLGARGGSDVGPFRVAFQLSPSTDGGSEIAIPPLGSLFLDSHDGPVRLTVRLDSLDQRRTEALLDDPAGLARAGATAPEDLRDALVRLGLRTLGVSVLASMLLAGLAFRSVRRVAWSGGLALLVTGGALGTAALTVRPQALAEPRYEGLLINAPALIGDAQRIADDYTRYAEQLQRLVGNVGKLYTTVSTLPIYQAAPDTTRILHVSDLHLNPAAWPVIRTVVEQYDIDLVIDTGDITDWGSEPETTYVSMIGQLEAPYVYIRGNHDSPRTAAAVASQPNAVVLDDSVTTIAGVTIAGIADPRFTPDKQAEEAGPWEEPATTVEGTGTQLATTIRALDQPVDIALVHDPASAPGLNGTVPLVLAGHTHQREVTSLPPNGEVVTRLAVQGSTGGAGLRGLEGDEPMPLAMSVLYLGADNRLQAYDDIRVGGTGMAQVSLNRKVVDDTAPADPAAPSVSPAAASEAPAGN
ncbi:metallophosphoesterase [Micromonospora endolithica]|uniref:Metallophosphoesterase n=2 Tax=Micromonospora endolithica TaxID=230091 RepID=A0A3A9ZL04_9ACTN|nr:metallophosphoesterase [Micromonospora endolithica]RKN47936.1 metallophosphoesterase [Micromonospora endolithica]TWJ21344.1 calcineurin-like phosphoesterase family protein [Micromonospora endolithica]